MQEVFNFDLHNPFVQHTLFAFASFALGLLAMALGQRVASAGKIGMLLGTVVGGFTVYLFTTPFASLALGFGGVFLVAFLASGLLLRVTLGTAGGAPAAPAKKPAPTAAPASSGTPKA